MTTATLVAKIESIDLPAANWRKICFVGFLAAAMLLIFYVWQISQLTEGYYLVNNYQSQIKDFSEENKNLQAAFAESSFLGQAQEKIMAMNFQKTTAVKYIQVSDVALAKAK